MLVPVTVALRANQPGFLTTAQVDGNFTALAAAINALYGPVINDATAARTLALTDAYAYIRSTGAAAYIVTVPPHASVNFDTGTEITVSWQGTGKPSFVAGAGVTINATALGIAARYQAATLKYAGGDVWDLIGALA